MSLGWGAPAQQPRSDSDLASLRGLLGDALVQQNTILQLLEAISVVQADLLKIAKLTLHKDTEAKTLAAWKQLAEERGDASDKLYRIGELLSRNGCDCDCDCDCDGHDDDCDRCLACRISEVVGK